MRDGFNETAFKEYLSDQFPEPMSAPFTRDLIDNILAHAHKNYHVGKDMFVNFLDKMIPEITFEEIIQFAEDGILTKDTIELKRMAMIKIREEIYQ
ncbi:MAG: hypothetical protein J6S14_15680 [Clostridia bacterium]|nr:hypothetical protein [Clostridia bacterium]